MEMNNEYNQEIDLKDLMFAILRRWRTVLSVAVVLAVLLGGLKGFKALQTAKDTKVQQERMEDYQRELDSYTTAKESGEREIENINDDIQAQQTYMDESVLMNMSPYDVCEATADLFIKTDYQIMPGMVYQNADYTDSILQAYQSALTSAALQENVAKTASLEPQYLKELVSVSRGSVADGNATNSTGYTRFTNLLTITVRYSDKEKAQEILNNILDNVTAMQEQIAGTIGPHSVSIVNQTVGSTVDVDLAKQQKAARDQITDLQKSLSDKEAALKELKEPQAPSLGMRAVIKTGVKYAILGGILGVFAVAFCISALFVMSDKVYAAKDIRRRYGLDLLGTVVVDGKKNGGIDAWLARLEGRKVCADSEQNGALLAANMQNYAGDRKKLLVTGLVEESQLKQVVEMVQKQLKGYELAIGANMLECAETLKKLPECEGVVLVEQSGVSGYSEMTQEIEKIKSMDKAIVGCVVFES